jgi:hypothetical protein
VGGGTGGPGSTTQGGFGADQGSRYLGFSYGLGQRTGGILGASEKNTVTGDPNQGRSID